MLAFRSVVRHAPRKVLRSSIPLNRIPLATSIRATSNQRSRPLAFSRATQAFSSSAFRRDQLSDELHNKLSSEVGLEMETPGREEPAPSIKEYLENSEFKIEDIPGQEEVKLTRKYGDETITVTFSVADINNPDMEPDTDVSDHAMYDEHLPEDTQSGGANTKGAVNQGRTSGGNYKVEPEDSVALADRPELADDAEPETTAEDPSFPTRMNISIERPGKGALGIEAIAQDGSIQIENVFYFPKPEFAHVKSAEQDWKRRGLYLGPPFGNLDDEVQDVLERYVDERGINTSMALFVPDYIDFKEQKEYIRWLQNLKSFVE